MIARITPHLYVGGADDCMNWYGPVVHACKYPCYMRIAGQQRKPTDPEYLAIEIGRDLFLNMVDTETSRYFRVDLFERSLNFIDMQLTKGPVLVHCNQGLSRAPSIALLWLAKRTDVLPRASYLDARLAFQQLYPAYAPGPGINDFLRDKWDEIP